VLIGVDDIAAGVGQEGADPGDQPRSIGAGEEQPRCRKLGDTRIMAGKGAAAGSVTGVGIIDA
jgi:hypothetical protein